MSASERAWGRFAFGRVERLQEIVEDLQGVGWERGGGAHSASLQISSVVAEEVSNEGRVVPEMFFAELAHLGKEFLDLPRVEQPIGEEGLQLVGDGPRQFGEVLSQPLESQSPAKPGLVLRRYRRFDHTLPKYPTNACDIAVLDERLQRVGSRLILV